MPITGIPLPFVVVRGLVADGELHRGGAAAEHPHAPPHGRRDGLSRRVQPAGANRPQERRAVRPRTLQHQVAVHRPRGTRARARARPRRPGGCARRGPRPVPAARRCGRGPRAGCLAGVGHPDLRRAGPERTEIWTSCSRVENLQALSISSSRIRCAEHAVQGRRRGPARASTRTRPWPSRPRVRRPARRSLGEPVSSGGLEPFDQPRERRARSTRRSSSSRRSSGVDARRGERPGHAEDDGDRACAARGPAGRPARGGG